MQRDLLRPQVLLHRHRVVGAAFDGGVVGDDDDLAPLDPGDAGDHPGARRGAVVEVLGRQRRELEEGASRGRRGGRRARAAAACRARVWRSRDFSPPPAAARASRSAQLGGEAAVLGLVALELRRSGAGVGAQRVLMPASSSPLASATRVWPRATWSPTATRTSATSAVPRALDRELHLHRLEDDEDVALGDRGAGLGSGRRSRRRASAPPASRRRRRRRRRRSRRRARSAPARRAPSRSQTRPPSRTTLDRAVDLDRPSASRPPPGPVRRPRRAPAIRSAASPAAHPGARSPGSRRGSRPRPRPRARPAAPAPRRGRDWRQPSRASQGSSLGGGPSSSARATAGSAGSRRRRRDRRAEALDQAGVELARRAPRAAPAAPAGRRRWSPARATTQLGERPLEPRQRLPRGPRRGRSAWPASGRSRCRPRCPPRCRCRRGSPAGSR